MPQGVLTIVCALPLALIALFLFLYVLEALIISALNHIDLDGPVILLLSVVIIMTSAAFVNLNGLQNPSARWRAHPLQPLMGVRASSRMRVMSE